MAKENVSQTHSICAKDSLESIKIEDSFEKKELVFNQVWSDFFAKITEVELLQREVKRAADTEIGNHANYIERATESDVSESLTTSFHNIFAFDLVKNEKRQMKALDFTKEERLRRAYLRKNRHYQWLLVEGYEVFDGFIKNAYAVFALLDPALWKLKELGEVNLSETKKLTFGHLKKLVTDRRKSGYTLLKALRGRLDLDRQINPNLHPACHVFGEILIVQQFRHHIVHKGGFIPSLKQVNEKIVEQFDGHEKATVQEFIALELPSYIGSGDYKNLIVLLEYSEPGKEHLPFHYSAFSPLLGVLVSMALLLKHVFELNVLRLKTQDRVQNPAQGGV